MKFLEAKAAQHREHRTSDVPPKIENKMMGGSLPKEQKPVGPTVRPDVQRMADELGVDLRTVHGTGKDGAILLKDVRAAASELS
jgi:pyruvate/2-oxoglutarate dehydrogenase complex dihydrolipoamide acyltransferase (E2) component